MALAPMVSPDISPKEYGKSICNRTLTITDQCADNQLSTFSNKVLALRVELLAYESAYQKINF